MEFLLYFYISLSLILTTILAIHLLIEDLNVLYSSGKIEQGKFGFNYKRKDSLHLTLLTLFFCLPFINLSTLLFLFYIKLIKIKIKPKK